MLVASAAIAAYGTTYFIRMPGNEHFARYIFPLRLHIAGGIGALLAGPWQFSEKLRARALNLHRWLGRFYLLEVALGSIAGFAMALVSEQGLPTHLGFGILANIMVRHRSAGVPAGAPRKHRSAPPVDDSKLRPEPCRRHPSPVHAVDAGGSSLALPAHLHHRVLAVLGPEPADRGMDGSPSPAPARERHDDRLTSLSPFEPLLFG
jgi:hypothetical protein